MSFPALCMYFAIIWTLVGLIWLFTFGGILIRSRHYVPPRPKRLLSNVSNVAILVAADWFSGFFWIVLVAQGALAIVAFGLGLTTFLLFPGLKTPTGHLLGKVLKLIDSPAFPRW